MQYTLHQCDLPNDLIFSDSVAIDTETMGLKPYRDRLCLIQLFHPHHGCHLIQIHPNQQESESPNLKKLIINPDVQKIFHYARFDVMQLQKYFNVVMSNIYCTKIASKLIRTYSSKHGLKELCKELLEIELDKVEQTSDWGRAILTKKQLTYAANDVIYLHRLQNELNKMLQRENRVDMAKACFDFLPTKCQFDVFINDEYDIFSYKGD
jgi:ribonuclease D